MNITLNPERIDALAQVMGVSGTDLAAIISRGASHSYKAGDYLYHESTPRLWMGIVEEGEIEIVRGLHGRAVRLATLAFVKKAAAAANSELGVLDRKRAEAIAAACDEIIAGNLHEHFTVDMIQGGAGTSTNMNAKDCSPG